MDGICTTPSDTMMRTVSPLLMFVGSGVRLPKSTFRIDEVLYTISKPPSAPDAVCIPGQSVQVPDRRRHGPGLTGNSLRRRGVLLQGAVCVCVCVCVNPFSRAPLPSGAGALLSGRLGATWSAWDRRGDREGVVASRAHRGDYWWSNTGAPSQDAPTQTAHRTRDKRSCTYKTCLPGFCLKGCQYIPEASG